MEILQIAARDTYPIRHEVLRAGRSLESCIFDKDEDEQTFHLGAFLDGQLVSIASFYYESNGSFSDEHQYRLRGMATLPAFRGKGLSKELLKMGFPIIKQNFCSLLWCNARVSASGYYNTVGFEKTGNEFIIEDIGAHLLMYKNLQSSAIS